MEVEKTAPIVNAWMMDSILCSIFFTLYAIEMNSYGTSGCGENKWKNHRLYEINLLHEEDLFRENKLRNFSRHTETGMRLKQFRLQSCTGDNFLYLYFLQFFPPSELARGSFECGGNGRWNKWRRVLLTITDPNTLFICSFLASKINILAVLVVGHQKNHSWNRSWER